MSHLFILIFTFILLLLLPSSTPQCSGRGTLIGSPPKCQCNPGYKPFTQNDCSLKCPGSTGTCCPGYYCSGGVQHNCPAGTYAPSGSSSCTNCAPGYWCSMNSDSATQNRCEPGTWAGEGTPNGCAFCDAGYYCTAGSPSPRQNPCAPGSYSIGAASTCSPCDAGYYCESASTTSAQHACAAGTYSTSGSASCTDCTAGFYCLESSPSATQFACPPGHYSLSGASQCEKCAAGYYCPSAATTTPTAQICSAGYYSSQGAVFCEACDPGYACPNQGTTTAQDVICSPGTYSQGGASSCLNCTAGYYCGEGSNSPVEHECSAGTYSLSGASSCLNCSAGYYCSSASSSSTQNPCPDGYYSQDGAAQCEKCAAGHYCTAPSTTPTQHVCNAGQWSFEGSAECNDCFAGFFCLQGATSPTANKCPAGTYSFSGASTCTNCSAGYYCREGSTSPTASPCAPGYWSVEGSAECTKCPAGFECSGTGTIQPTASPCPPGKYCDEACTACVNCPEGYICPQNATTHLETHDNPCPDGFYSTSGSFTCLPCAAGFYCTGISSTPFQYICPPGHWSKEGSSSCGTCQAGFKCDSGSTSPNATECVPGTWSAGGSASCALCPAGYECPNTQTSNPTASPCGAGTFCAQGCTQCRECTPGFHCEPMSQSSSQHLCPTGYYCPAGSQHPGISNPCPSGYTSGPGASTAEQCNLAMCFGLVQTDSANVCSGRGVCTSADVCVCSGSWTGAQCDVPVCHGKSGGFACNFPNGTCDAPNSCICSTGWIGMECNRYTCGGIAYNDPLVCNQHGLCSQMDVCQCETGYAGHVCSDFLCYGLSSSDANVCSGHGTCFSTNNCTCATGYTGAQCTDFTCHGMDSNQPSVCSTHGACTAYDTCTCSSPYFGDLCDEFDCFGTSPNVSSVCSGHGSCTSPNTCSCATNYISQDCSVHLCFGINATAPFVCSSKGACVDVDKCSCAADRHGDECELLFDNPPTTVLKAPRHVGPCDSLLLDGSFSFNQFDDGALRYHWSVVSAASNFTQLQALLQSHIDSSTVLIAPSYISSQGTFKFALYVNDTRHVPGFIKEVTVTKIGQNAPQLVIEGFNEYTITRSQQLDIRGTLRVHNCFQIASTAVTDDSVSYTWSQTSGAPVSFRSGRNVMSFASLSFPVGEHSYTFQLTGTLLSSGISTSAAVTVHVVRDKLKPLIAGGDRTISSSTPLILDASSSVDPDEDPTPAKYHWSCTTCTNQFVFFAQQNQRKVMVPANTFLPDQTHSFRLNFTKGQRWEISEVRVAFVQSNAPQVTVSGGGLVNRNERLILRAFIDLTYFSGAENDLQSYWTSHNVDLSSSVLVERADQKTRHELALKENILEIGKTYEFSYRVVTRDTIVSASTTVTLNAPPQNGRFDVTPPSGTQYETEFQLVAPAWIDPQLPLQYMFEYALAALPDQWRIIQAFSARSTASFVPIHSGVIHLRLTVRDSRGAETTTQQSVSVASAFSGEFSLPADLLEAVKTVTQVNGSVVENDDLVLHRIESGFKVLNQQLGLVSTACALDCISSIQTLQETSLERLRVILSKLPHTEHPNDKQVETIVSALNEITEHSSTLSATNTEASWRILNTSICSFPKMTFSNQDLFPGIVSILDRLWTVERQQGTPNFSRAQSILKCVSGNLFRQKVNGETQTMINADNFGVQVFKDIVPYMRQMSAMSLFGGSLQVSTQVGHNMDESVAVALEIVRYAQSPVNGSVIPVSSVLDISFFNAESDELIEVNSLPQNDTNQFSFELDAAVFENLPAGQHLECRYWDEDAQDWTTNGVETLSVDTTSLQVTCSASHASLFAIVARNADSDSSPLMTAREILIYIFAAGVGINAVTCCCVCFLVMCCSLCCTLCICTCRRKKYSTLETERTNATLTRAESIESSLDSASGEAIPNKDLEEWIEKVDEADGALRATISRLTAISDTMDKLNVSNEHLLNMMNQAEIDKQRLESVNATPSLDNDILLQKQQLRISNRHLLLKTFEAMKDNTSATQGEDLHQRDAELQRLRRERDALRAEMREIHEEVEELTQEPRASEGILRLQQMMEQERQGAKVAIRQLERERKKLRQICKANGIAF